MAVLMTVPELAKQMHKDKDELYRLAKRHKDPLPVRYLGEHARYGAVLVSEFEQWFLRNTVLMNER